MGVYVHAPDPAGSPGPAPNRTPADQARVLIKAMLANRALGATRILLVNLVAWSNFSGDSQSMFNFMGLISSGTDSGDTAADLGRERIAYYAYQHLIATTETDVAELVGPRTDFPAPLRVIELRRRGDGQAFYVAWSDGADARLNLLWVGPEARIVDLVPDAIGNFAESAASPTDGRLSLTVGKNPLLIEPR